jgi:hypothetical protein
MVVSRSGPSVVDSRAPVRDPRLLETTVSFSKVYNSGVNSPVSQKPASDDKHQQRHSVYAAEATGLLLMAVLLLILTIVRYWRYIPWSAR